VTTGGSDPATWKLPRLRIDRDGTWFAEDGEVTHPGLLANLRGNLRVDQAGHYLQVGPARVPVEVEDAPLVVVRVELGEDGATVALSDETREALALDTLRLGPGEIPYCRVKEGRFEARFSRAATWELLQRMEHDERTGEALLVLGGTRHPIPLTERA
jgi:hypothetical protein